MQIDSQLTSLQDAMVVLAKRVEAIDIRKFELHPPAVLVTELSPCVLDVLRDAQRTVAELVDVCERATSDDSSPPSSDVGATLPFLPFESALDVVVERKSASLRTIGDIAFLASLEIRQRLERLERVANHGNHWAIIGECDGSLRRVRKALVTIDRAFARAGIAEAQLDYASELEISLDVRRTYAKLRARVRAVGEPDGETFYVQLRAAGTALATIVGWRGYSHLRVRDRMQLRELQRRLLDWFRSERDTDEGRRLWRDLDSFVQMLADVNRRQELREHDARAIAAALATIPEGDAPLPPSTMKLLESLTGLDEEVDALLLDTSCPDAASVWRAPLERLAHELPTVKDAL